MPLLTYENFCKTLISGDPEAEQLYAEHLKDNDAELPHVFLGRWSDLIVQRYRKDPRYHLPENIKELINGASTSTDNKLLNLIGVSFIENVADAKDICDRLAADLLPELGNKLLNYWKQ